ACAPLFGWGAWARRKLVGTASRALAMHLLLVLAAAYVPVGIVVLERLNIPALPWYMAVIRWPRLLLAVAAIVCVAALISSGRVFLAALRGAITPGEDAPLEREAPPSYRGPARIQVPTHRHPRRLLVFVVAPDLGAFA